MIEIQWKFHIKFGISEFGNKIQTRLSFIQI
jgi:hypothetical protein